VFVEAVRDIQKGDELGYDYEIGRDKDDPPNVDEIFACHCGSPKCRGTMLWPAKRPKPRAKAKAKAKTKLKAKTKPKTKSTPKTKPKTKSKAKAKSKSKSKSAPARRR
jgi:hypothetical protein